jgi:hypothetical protein
MIVDRRICIRLISPQTTPSAYGGHPLLPAQHVATHRSGHKNDRNDAHAILRAGRDSQIKAVPIKSPQALVMQALHRARSGYVGRRTALSNQMRGLLLAHGIAMAKGHAALLHGVSRVIEDVSQPVPEVRVGWCPRLNQKHSSAAHESAPKALRWRCAGRCRC